MNSKFEDEFAYCMYIAWAIRNNLKYQEANKQCDKLNNYENKYKYK